MTSTGAKSWQAIRMWIAQILVLAFAFRALVPAGYMPDFDAIANGTFKVVICSSNGSHVVALDADEGGQKTKDSSFSAHQVCAFSGIASVDLPDLSATLSNPFGSHTVETLKANPADALPPVRAGPVLGSRGPPQLS